MEPLGNWRFSLIGKGSKGFNADHVKCFEGWTWTWLCMQNVSLLRSYQMCRKLTGRWRSSFLEASQNALKACWNCQCDDGTIWWVLLFSRRWGIRFWGAKGDRNPSIDLSASDDEQLGRLAAGCARALAIAVRGPEEQPLVGDIVCFCCSECV